MFRWQLAVEAEEISRIRLRLLTAAQGVESQLSWTISLRPKRAFSRAATFWARRMAAMALRVKSDEGRRLPRGSDFGLATDRFILA